MSFVQKGRNVEFYEKFEDPISRRVVGLLKKETGQKLWVSGSSNIHIDRWVIGEDQKIFCGLAIKKRNLTYNVFRKHSPITPLWTYQAATGCAYPVLFCVETVDKYLLVFDLEQPTTTGFYSQGYTSKKFDQGEREVNRPSGHDACWFNCESAMYILPGNLYGLPGQKPNSKSYYYGN